MRLLLIAIVVAGLAATNAHTESVGSCDLLAEQAKVERRPLVADDLVRLRDIGPANDELPERQLFTLSPDRRLIAFQVRRAKPAANHYCLGMILLPVDGKGDPLLVDTGGDAIFYDPATMGGMGVPTGIPLPITPSWSPDGRWIYFLKRSGGPIALWRARTDGSGSEPIVQAQSDIVDFRLLDERTALLRLASKEGAPSDAAERLEGYHYDERFIPIASDEPLLKESAPARYLRADLDTGTTRVPDPADVAASGIEQAPAPSAMALSKQGGVAEVRADDDKVPASQYLVATIGEKKFHCATGACAAASAPIWWDRKGRRVRFMARDGWAKQENSIYEWTPYNGEVRRLYGTPDLLIDCQPAEADRLICLRETSLRPRHILSLDLVRRQADVLLDLNPEFQSLALGAARRISLSSNAGIPAFADLVLPVDWRPERRYPLIVVQYRSRGFLRGGVGDEFPVQLFANNGFAALSIDRPAPVGSLAQAENYVEIDRLGLIDFADRRNILSAVEQAVRKAIDAGIADPRRIGISGLSDGSSTVQFAALNSDLFAAGAVSGCCWERNQTALLGPRPANLYHRIGWPKITEPADGFWSSISLAQNARRVAFPMLFSMADDEFRLALESYTALREVGKPADMFVFDNEHHIKWQPAHRLAAYQRALDWFNFWLRDIRPQDERRAAEVLRWSRMKGAAERPDDHSAAPEPTADQ